MIHWLIYCNNKEGQRVKELKKTSLIFMGIYRDDKKSYNEPKHRKAPDLCIVCMTWITDEPRNVEI